MERLLALMLVFAATTPFAAAQPQTEPRLAGGPERICSGDEIRQALDGSYAGPPCRFTEMPAGLDAVPQRPVPQHAAVQPAMAPPAHDPQPVPLHLASRSQPVLARSEQPHPVSYGANLPAGRQPLPAGQHAAVSQRHEGNSFIASQQSSSVRAHTVGRQWPPLQPLPPAGHSSPRPESRRGEVEANRGETIRLSDGFFSGGLVGGVERPFAPLYSYRGLILIAADGHVRTGHAGLDHRVLQVRALDHRRAAVPQTAPRRAYPYR